MLLGDPKAIFDYLDHEGQFQAAAAAITGAAAAWWLKALLTPARDAAPLRHPLASRIAATLLAASAASFFIERGRIAQTYGRLARMQAETGQIPGDSLRTLVRSIWSLDAIVQHFPYFAARALLLAAALVVAWMLFANASPTTRASAAPHDTAKPGQ